MMTHNIITLLTDFGWQDVYVGVMKGAIARINSQLQVIDLTHDIPPQDIAAARFCLSNAYPYFPPQTVHVAVVDPGVGSKRRGVAIQFSGGFIVCPDNGLCSGILETTSVIAAVELNNPQYWRSPNPSHTFHGRDIFAPVGAHLATGVPLAELGDAIAPESLIRLPLPELQIKDTEIAGCIQYIDRFGNSISNIRGDRLEGESWLVTVADKTIRLATTYSDVAPGEVLALVGSHGWLEVAVNSGNAAQQLSLQVGSELKIKKQ
ncbi:MAG: SAM-dependent chlorinase/fluorinase [Pleurocapsa sp.]